MTFMLVYMCYFETGFENLREFSVIFVTGNPYFLNFKWKVRNLTEPNLNSNEFVDDNLVLGEGD